MKEIDARKKYQIRLFSNLLSKRLSSHGIENRQYVPPGGVGISLLFEKEVQVPKGSWKVDGGYISGSGVLVCDNDAGYWRAIEYGTGEPFCKYTGRDRYGRKTSN